MDLIWPGIAGIIVTFVLMIFRFPINRIVVISKE